MHGFDPETLRMPDLEELREHLGIERCLLDGGSLGSALALEYGQAHPDRTPRRGLELVHLGRRSCAGPWRTGARIGPQGCSVAGGDGSTDCVGTVDAILPP